MRFTQEKRSELDELKGEVAPKIAQAVTVLHDGGYGIIIDTHVLGIDDPFVVASITADLGSVNPSRIKVRPQGTTIKVVFDSSGLGATQTAREAMLAFEAIRGKLLHRVAKIRLYEGTTP